MPKHKKTRAQKKIADERNHEHVSVQQLQTNPTYVFSAKNAPLLKRISHTDVVSTIAVAKKDLQKTALISLAIVAIQLLFFFLLKTHALALNFVRY